MRRGGSARRMVSPGIRRAGAWGRGTRPLGAPRACAARCWEWPSRPSVGKDPTSPVARSHCDPRGCSSRSRRRWARRLHRGRRRGTPLCTPPPKRRRSKRAPVAAREALRARWRRAAGSRGSDTRSFAARHVLIGSLRSEIKRVNPGAWNQELPGSTAGSPRRCSPQMSAAAMRRVSRADARPTR